MPDVTGIGGVFFKARDAKALVAWYREHFGFPENGEPYHAFAWREADRPERLGSTVWSVFPETTNYFEPSGARLMVNLRVRDLDATRARLRAEGVEVDERVEDYEYGRFGWAMDPEGNRIELWQPAEAEEVAAGAGEAERGVRAAHDAMVRGELDRDLAALERLIADDFHGLDLLRGPLTKSDILESSTGGRVSIEAHEVADLEARAYGVVGTTSGTASIRGRAEGAAFEHRVSFMDVWALRAGAWRLVAAHVAPAG